jgi:hypothetical protein
MFVEIPTAPVLLVFVCSLFQQLIGCLLNVSPDPVFPSPFFPPSYPFLHLQLGQLWMCEKNPLRERTSAGRRAAVDGIRPGHFPFESVQGALLGSKPGVDKAVLLQLEAGRKAYANKVGDRVGGC